MAKKRKSHGGAPRRKGGRPSLAQRKRAGKRRRPRRAPARVVGVDAVVLFEAPEGTAAPGFQPLDQWPADGTLRFTVQWRMPNDMAKIIEEAVIEMPLPVELATVGSVFRSRLRAQLEEWKAAHPELGDESPAIAVSQATVGTGEGGAAFLEDMRKRMRKRGRRVASGSRKARNVVRRAGIQLDRAIGRAKKRGYKHLHRALKKIAKRHPKPKRRGKR